MTKIEISVYIQLALVYAEIGGAVAAAHPYVSCDCHRMSIQVQRAVVDVDSSTHIHIAGKGNIAAFNNISSDFQTIRQASVLYKTYTIVPCVVCKLSRRSYFNVCAVRNWGVSIIQFSNYINLSCNIYAAFGCILYFEIVYS